VAGYIAFAATNSSPATLTSFTVGFDGEQWRDGGANGGTPVTQPMVLQYGFGTLFTDVTTWNEPGANFNWTAPVFTNTTTGAAVDGNGAGLVTGLGGTINGLDWTTGQTLWVRWVERNDAGNDHGLAIDNFAFAWTGTTIVPLYWDANGASPGIGGTGVWSATNVANVNWNPSAAGDGTPQNSDANKRLIFGGAGGVITIDTSVAANLGMEFDASYTLNGGVLTLGSISTIDIDGTVTINSALAGVAGLTKLGPGTLIITNAANPLEGTISINGGALSAGADGHFGNANNDIALSGGLLTFSNGFVLAAGRNLTGSGALRIPSGQTVTTQGTVNLSAVEIGSGDVEHDEGGTIALNGPSNTLGNVSLADPVVITSPTGINLTGNVTVNTGVVGASRITSPSP
jgi:autotransporter-associated beta strand protein